MARALGSRLPKPFTALSDAGFLVVGADGGVDVVVDVEAAAGVDDVVAVVEAAGAVVLGSFVDIVFSFLIGNVAAGVAPTGYSADGSRNIPFITLTAYG